MARWTMALSCGLGLLIAGMLTTEGFGRVLDERPPVFKTPHVLIVGPGKLRTKPSQAAADAQDGDIVEIAASIIAG